MKTSKKELSMTTKKRLARLVMCIGEQECAIELARQNLCNCPTFEPYTAFKRIDRNGNGYLTVYDILEFARENRMAKVIE
jgi:hypothetical protein